MVPWMRRPDRLAPADEATVVAAIREAERDNLGEVRVHLDGRSDERDVLTRAREAFRALGMGETKAGTGVLLYVAVADRQAAVYAGFGVHGAAEPGFWHEVVDRVARGYAEGRPVAGLVEALGRVGDLLRATVPGEDAAGNELPDEVSRS